MKKSHSGLVTSNIENISVPFSDVGADKKFTLDERVQTDSSSSEISDSFEERR